MGKVYISSGGGGIDLDVVTAAAGDILAGKVIVGPDGEPLTGTLPNRGQAQNAGGWGTGGSGSDAYFAMNRIPEGAYFSNGADWAPEVRMKQTDVRSAIGATNSANWRPNTTIAGLKGTMPEQGGKTVTPKSSNQTAVSANRYVTGNIIVAGDSNLNAANIKKGVRIFGITGTFEGWVPTATDLYLRGNNPAGFTLSNASFQTGEIMSTVDAYNMTLKFGKAYNLSGYSKINIQYMSVKSISTTISFDIDGDTSGNGDSVLKGVSFDSGTTNTVSLDISSINRSTIAGRSTIYIFCGTGSSRNTHHIYHIWLS